MSLQYEIEPREGSPKDILSVIEEGSSTITTLRDGRWYRMTYDAKGREVHYENNRGYWSRHDYEDHGKHGQTVSYYNAKKNWHRQHFDGHGVLQWLEREDGRWVVICDTSHRVYRHHTQDLFMVGQQVGTGLNLVAMLRNKPGRVCPTVIRAIQRYRPTWRARVANWLNHLFV
jgi:hypothetical protein